MNDFQKRIQYQGDLKPFLQKVCKGFNIGEYGSHKIVLIGYEDFNLVVSTSKGKFFVKVFGSFRDSKECSRYVDVIERALKAGVSHPILYKSTQGSLYQMNMSGSIDRLCVMQFIEGKTFYELKVAPTIQEMRSIVNQAALINKINLKPPFIYDRWAITSFAKEYKSKEQYLGKRDKKLIKPLIRLFNELAINKLPHCLVHGDIIKTNTMKSTTGDIYIIDFAMANYYPRIQELAVLLCDLFFDYRDSGGFIKNYNFALTEYKKHIRLTPDEINRLPNYVKLAHAMHILLANYEKMVNKNSTSENEYFLEIGRLGLRYVNKIWGA